jgi:glycosyltransferase involved in cell wall biosynthesis
MFEKMGQSLADSGEYEVHILGYPSRKEPQYPHIHFYPIKAFNRLSLYRLTIPFRLLTVAMKLNPVILIITTHELLFFSWVLKITKHTKIVYDVRENYFRNILFLPTFSILLRPFLAFYVRLKEKLFAPFVSLFILSDEGYTKELTFTKKKFIVVENKAKESLRKHESVSKDASTIQLLFSGTLAHSTGVFTAIKLAKSLHDVDNRVRLLIIGYCSHHPTLRQIQSAIESHDFIQLWGGDKLVPHDEIIEAINRSQFGIIAYPPNSATKNTFPTKIFEYIASRLPFLIINHPTWVNRCIRYPASITFDPGYFNPQKMLDKMKSTQFYLLEPGHEIYWSTEFNKLKNALFLL